MFTGIKIAFSAVVAAIIIAAYAQNLPADCSRTYDVQDGDTCNDISDQNNVSTYQLATVNEGIINEACDNLPVDQTICLGITGQDCTTTYTVQSEGETCDDIAQTAGIDTATLLANNPNVNEGCTNVGVGEVLCTAPDVVVQGGGGGASSGSPSASAPAPTGSSSVLTPLPTGSSSALTPGPVSPSVGGTPPAGPSSAGSSSGGASSVAPSVSPAIRFSKD